MALKPYNGYRSWAAWNVALWLGNDEGLYRRAYDLGRRYGATKAARLMRRELPASTPDGAVYSQLSVKLAIQGLIE